MKPVYIVGAGAVSCRGPDWRHWPRPDEVGVTDTFEVVSLPGARHQAEARARMLMSRGALLGAVAMANAIADVSWPPEVREEAAAFMGVGASGGEIPQLERILKASMGEDGFSEQRLCRRGVRACSPLFTFQLMNNFTLCHGSILEGVAGANGAFYSRGLGTVRALNEAWWALEEGTSAVALAGGADDALYPVTQDEIRRRGGDGGAPPSAGAGVLALSRRGEGALASLTVCEAWDAWPNEEVVKARLAGRMEWDLLITTAAASRGGEPRLLGAALAPDAPILDVSGLFGEALAATPALAWIFALSCLAGRRARRVAVLTAGQDGGLGLVALQA